MMNSAARVGIARVLFATVSISAITLLSACSSGATANPEVASLPGDSAPVTDGATSAPPDEPGGPQLRLDSSEEEFNAAWRGYHACLKEHGHKMIAGRGDGYTPNQNDNSDTAKKATKTCRGKLPQQPPEMDKDRNPHYVDDYHAYMTCLTSKGMAVHAIDPFGTGWTYDEGVTQKLDGTALLKVEKECEIEAFSAK